MAEHQRKALGGRLQMAPEASQWGDVSFGPLLGHYWRFGVFCIRIQLALPKCEWDLPLLLCRSKARIWEALYWHATHCSMEKHNFESSWFGEEIQAPLVQGTRGVSPHPQTGHPTPAWFCDIYIYRTTFGNLRVTSIAAWEFQTPRLASSQPSKHAHREVQGTGILHDDSDHHIPGGHQGGSCWNGGEETKLMEVPRMSTGVSSQP